jgi:hypothetical protein
MLRQFSTLHSFRAELAVSPVGLTLLPCPCHPFSMWCEDPSQLVLHRQHPHPPPGNENHGSCPPDLGSRRKRSSKPQNAADTTPRQRQYYIALHALLRATNGGDSLAVCKVLAAALAAATPRQGPTSATGPIESCAPVLRACPSPATCVSSSHVAADGGVA